MNLNNYEVNSADVSAVKQAYLVKVFGWMGFGLLTTAIVSAFVVNSIGYLSPIAFFIAIAAEVILVIKLVRNISKMTAQAATASFIGYSALNGFTLSGLFMLYTAESVVSSFLIASSIFVFMAIYGYTTKKDLSALGSFLMMGLVGLIVALLINFFLQNSMLHLIISGLFVLVFTGLTAYDVQKITQIGLNVEGSGSEIVTKSAILGALTLYLDFINLFIWLLHLTGIMRD